MDAVFEKIAPLHADTNPRSAAGSGPLDGTSNPLIGTTAAQIPAHRRLDLFGRGMRVLGQEQKTWAKVVKDSGAKAE